MKNKKMLMDIGKIALIVLATMSVYKRYAPTALKSILSI